MRADTAFSNLFAYAFATHLLFGLVQVLNTSELVFIYYFPRAIDITIIDPNVDIMVWIASVILLSIIAAWRQANIPKKLAGITIVGLAVLLSINQLLNVGSLGLRGLETYVLFTVGIAAFALLAYSHKPFGESISITTMKSLVYFLAYLAAIEASSATNYVVRAFDITTQIGKMDAGIELQLSYASYGLLPWLYVVFLFSWAWVPPCQRLLLKSLRLHPSKPTVNQQGLLPEGHSYKWLEVLQDPRFVLSLALGTFIGFYPYFQSPPWLVGTDALWRYYKPLLRMNSQGVIGGFLQAFAERHPITLATFYATQLVFQTTAFTVVRYSPIVLVIGLGLATWGLLARKKSMNFGILVFTLSMLSISTTVGLYSSILSNWMALVVWAIFFGYVAFRGDKGFRIIDGIILFLLSTLILLIHPWTWGVFATAVLIAAVLTLIQDRWKGLRSGGMLLAVVLLDILFAFLSITFLAGSQGWRIADTLNLYLFVINNPSSVLNFWPAVKWLTSVWSPFFSPLYITMSIAGVFVLFAANLSPWRRRLILAWLCVSGIGSVLVAPVGFNPVFSIGTELWRLLFLTPFQLTAPLGIVWLAQLPKRLLRNGNPNTAPSAHWSVRWTLPCAILSLGVLLALAPVWLRFFVILVALPAVTVLVLTKNVAREGQILADIVLLCFVLVAFNNTTRALSQLLLDPHNCDTC